MSVPIFHTFKIFIYLFAKELPYMLIVMHDVQNELYLQQHSSDNTIDGHKRIIVRG